MRPPPGSECYRPVAVARLAVSFEVKLARAVKKAEVSAWLAPLARFGAAKRRAGSSTAVASSDEKPAPIVRGIADRQERLSTLEARLRTAAAAPEAISLELWRMEAEAKQRRRAAAPPAAPVTRSW